LFVKILSFDRSLPGRARGQIVMGLLYQGKYLSSADVTEEVQHALKQLPDPTVAGLQVRVVLIDLDGTHDLAGAISRERVTVLYVSPLRAIDLNAVSAVARTAQVTTLTGVPRYVETGLAIGIDMP